MVRQLPVLELLLLLHAAAAAATAGAGDPLAAPLSELLAQHGHDTATAPASDDTHAAMVALSRRKRKTPPPAARGSAGLLLPRAAVSPNCVKSLQKLCGAQKGNVSTPDVQLCKACTAARESTLSKDGCPASAVKEFCRAPKPVCPATVGAQVNATGLLPVDMFRKAANGSEVPCDEATRLALNMTQACGGTVYFATKCAFASTVIVPGGTSFKGGGDAGGSEFLFRPQTEIVGPRDGPAFLVQHTTSVDFSNLAISGHNTGVIVTDSALVRCVIAWSRPATDLR